jgi:plastocyanin
MARSFGGTLAVKVLLPDGTPLAGVVVNAQPTSSGPVHPAPPVEAVMDQANRTFRPDLLVVPVNSTVSFANSDTVSHQIYSFSPAKRFQLPLYRGTPYPPVRFEQPGLVTLGCNIHDEMLAYVVVTGAPFFGRTATNGSWSAEVPSGTYRVWIWHPRIWDEDKDLQGEITLTEAAGGTLTLRLRKALKPSPLGGRPHSWDSY